MSFVSSGTADNVGAKAKSAAEAVLGTGADTADTAYDMKSGALLTFLLLFALGWIPILGQMVSGYVGGRRSGSPVRGLAATGAATVCVLIVLTVISFILYSVNGALADDPAAEIAAVSATSPVLGQLMSAGVGY